MTEPNEGTDVEPPAPHLAAPESIQTPDATQTPTSELTPVEPGLEPAPTEPDVPPANLWAPPPGSEGGTSRGRRRGCVTVALVGALLVLGFLVFTIFLGAQATALNGTIEFGTGGTGCAVTGAAATFPPSAAIRSVAHLANEVTAGTTLTTIVTFADGTTQNGEETLSQSGRCVTQDIEAGLSPGHYGLEYRVGTDVLAKGGFDVTP